MQVQLSIYIGDYTTDMSVRTQLNYILHCTTDTTLQAQLSIYMADYTTDTSARTQLNYRAHYTADTTLRTGVYHLIVFR
jgi:F0F1-type ATP synthase delta subunit